jgi:RNA polymerase sigma-70 factor (ECF subfamily)
MMSLNKTMIAADTPKGSLPEAVFEADSREFGADERALVAALRNGDEDAFALLVDRHHNTLLRVAMFYVPSRAVAEEVVQETWIGVLQGIGRFEGRSSLKTWIFSILTHRAKTRGQQESRHISFSSLSHSGCESSEQGVDPDRFLPADHEHWPHHWALPPTSWGESPEKRLLSKETQVHLRQAIAALPETQQEVIRLRDIEQWTSQEVCNVLGISETNQRVLLHRARSRVRRGLESYFQKGLG